MSWKWIYAALVIWGMVVGHSEYVLNQGNLHPHSGIVYFAGADGHKIMLVHNESAKDVTYLEVRKFIMSDQTDRIPFQKENFTCGDYAELVQNAAENAGIKCAWVSIDFKDEWPGHACNAFNTTDKGIIFIDCTTSDARAILNVDQTYELTPIDLDADYALKPLGIVKNYEIYW
jgi:hypothetical protein